MNTTMVQPPATPPNLTFSDARAIAQELWGVGHIDATKEQQMPTLREWALTAAHLGALPSVLYAQTQVEGCLYIVLLVRVERKPTVVLIPVDARLSATQRTIEVVPVAETDWCNMEVIFQGSFLVGMRTAAKCLVLHDVVVSCGCSFVGSSRAPFAARQHILENITHTLNSLLLRDKWLFYVAPSTQCGGGGALHTVPHCESRGIWFVDGGGAAVNSTRWLWQRHASVRMVLYGRQWFVSDGGGDIVSKHKDIHIHVDSTRFPRLADIPPTSAGEFVARVERDGETRRKWLVLHNLNVAHMFRTADLQPWQHVRVNCSSASDVGALFERHGDSVSWANIQCLLAAVTTPAAPAAQAASATPPATAVAVGAVAASTRQQAGGDAATRGA